MLLGSVLRNLRLFAPAASITVVVEAAYAGILELNPDVDAVLPLPRKAREWPGFIRRLRALRCTQVLDFDNTERTALVTRLSGARQRVTFNRELVPFRGRWFYTALAHVTNHDYETHSIIDTNHALLTTLGIPVQSREVRLVPHAADIAATAKLVMGPQKKVLVHPGTRSPYRLWPVERFAAVCDRLQDESSAQVFIAAGPGERDIARAIRDQAQSHVVLLDQTFTTQRFAALLTQFDVLLCHDSGPMHIAAAVGTPVVALYSSQNATIWRPQGEHHTVLQASLPCACLPESQRPGPCTPGDSYRSYCVRRLDVDTVVRAMRARLLTP